jgi:virginiamycin A acetyltransferase
MVHSANMQISDIVNSLNPLNRRSSIKIPYGKHSYGHQPKILGEKPWVTYFAKGSSVGNYCSIAPGLKFSFRGKHDYHQVTTYPFVAFQEWGQNNAQYRNGKIDQAKIRSYPIIIENDVWIASNVTIKQGVHVGNGAVIGMESVVTKDVPPYGIVGGNPAQMVKYRFTPKQIEELLEIAWWNWDDATVKKFLPLLLAHDIDGFIEKAKEFLKTKK